MVIQGVERACILEKEMETTVSIRLQGCIRWMEEILPHFTPRVQVRTSHILTQNLYYNYYQYDKYLTIGYMDLRSSKQCKH